MGVSLGLRIREMLGMTQSLLTGQAPAVTEEAEEGDQMRGELTHVLPSIEGGARRIPS